MKPSDKMSVPETRDRSLWEHLTNLMRFNRPLVWVVLLVIGLIVFVIWLPAPVRVFFVRSLQSHRLLVGMTLGFGLLALSLLWSAGQRLDAWAFLFFNLRGYRPLWMDRLMWGFTQIGNSLTTIALALIFFLVGDRLLAYALALGTLTLWMMVELIKALVRRRRPFLRLTEARVVGHRESGRSFPSGHTSQVFFVATLLSNYFQVSMWALSLLYATALLVGLTRLYVGVHYPRDVLAGMILGSAWGLLGGIVLGYTPFGMG